MPYDRQLEDKFRFFKARITELEKASAAQDKAIRQLAEKMGIEVDLTAGPEVEPGQDHLRKAGALLHDEAIMALLEESEQDDAK